MGMWVWLWVGVGVWVSISDVYRDSVIEWCVIEWHADVALLTVASYLDCAMHYCMFGGRGSCNVVVTEQIEEVQGYVLEANNSEIVHCDYDSELKSVNAFYVNLSSVLSPYDYVSDGAHDAPHSVTTAILNEPERMLIIVLRPNLNETIINVTISGTTRLPRL